MDEDIEEIIWRHALRNAILHGGNAEVDAVVGGVMAEADDTDPREVVEWVKEIIGDVNELPLEAQEDEAEKLGLVLGGGEEENDELPEIPNEDEDAVITRAAPNPNGPFHLGSMRAFMLSYLYAERNDGRFILRYDDTDPSSPEKGPKKKFYGWIEEDLEWLGCEPDLVVRASDRLDIYYEFAYELLRDGNAYVCTCDQEKWKELRDRKRDCPCRDLSPDKQIERWHGMQDGDYDEGGAVVRIKTDIEHKNPAERDWPAFRILKDHEHPYVSQDYVVWPLYNFASSIDDHELGVTHIFRAKEHSTNTKNQKWLYKHFGWGYPTTIHHGFLSLKGAVLSTSEMRMGIESGEFDGWDDPRLGTIRALRRRGFQPETFHGLVKKFGVKDVNAEVSTDELSSMNRKVIDPEANRYFFLPNPVKIEVENPGKTGEVELPVHPDRKGTRKIKVGSGILVEEMDLEANRGETIRLKDLYNIRIPETGKSCKYAGDEIVRDMPKIHWLPESKKERVDAEVVMPSAKERTGTAEANVLDEDEGAVLQFERFGFVRLDRKNKKKATFYFAHK